MFYRYQWITWLPNTSAAAPYTAGGQLHAQDEFDNLVAACVTEDAKVLATPLTYAGYPYAGLGYAGAYGYAGLGYAGAYGYAGYPYAVAAPAKVEVETVKAPAVLPAVRRKMVHLESSRTRFYQTAAVPHRDDDVQEDHDKQGWSG